MKRLNSTSVSALARVTCEARPEMAAKPWFVRMLLQGRSPRFLGGFSNIFISGSGLENQSKSELPVNGFVAAIKPGVACRDFAGAVGQLVIKCCTPPRPLETPKYPFAEK